MAANKKKVKMPKRIKADRDKVRKLGVLPRSPQIKVHLRGWAVHIGCAAHGGCIMARGVGETFLTRILKEEILSDVVQDVILNGTNSLDVNVQDQATRAFDIPFHQNLGTTTLAVDMAADAYSFTATAGHGIQATEDIALYDTAAAVGFDGYVLAVNGNVISMDTPAIATLAAATTVVVRSTHDLNVNGAITRQTFIITNPFEAAEDVVRVMFLMVTENFPELNMFGDIEGGITRGMVMRRVNGGASTNYFNVKTNADLVLLMHDVTFYEAAKHGVNGLGGRLTYGGQTKHGVVIRLAQGESLEMIVQDDLTGLTTFHVAIAGHVTSGNGGS